MSSSIHDILSTKDFSEPPELQEIKTFVESAVGITPLISVTTNSFIVSLPNGSAIGALRTQINILQNQLKTNKRIILRIR